VSLRRSAAERISKPVLRNPAQITFAKPKLLMRGGDAGAASAGGNTQGTVARVNRLLAPFEQFRKYRVYPSRLESLFKMEPLINHVLLIGDRLPFVTALFTVNIAAAQTLKGMDEWKRRPEAEVTQAPPLLAEIHKAVARVNKLLAPFEQIRKYRVLPREFSIEQGELTATMKVRRTRAVENFKEQIDELYAGREVNHAPE